MLKNWIKFLVQFSYNIALKLALWDILLQTRRYTNTPISRCMCCRVISSTRAGHSWHQMSLLRPGVIKQRKPNPSAWAAQKYHAHYLEGKQTCDILKVILVPLMLMHPEECASPALLIKQLECKVAQSYSLALSLGRGQGWCCPVNLQCAHEIALLRCACKLMGHILFKPFAFRATQPFLADP